MSKCSFAALVEPLAAFAHVCLLQPGLPRFHSDARNIVYARHLDSTLPELQEACRDAERIFFVCFSLGGHALLEFLHRNLDVTDTISGIAFIDAVVNNLHQYDKKFQRHIRDLSVHWRASDEPLDQRIASEDGILTLSAGDLNHDTLAANCFPSTTRWIHERTKLQKDAISCAIG